MREKIEEIVERERNHAKIALIIAIATTTLLMIHPNIFALLATTIAITLLASTYSAFKQAVEIEKLIEEAESQ